MYVIVILYSIYDYIYYYKFYTILCVMTGVSLSKTVVVDL